MDPKKQKAYDMALSCRICRTPTDYELDEDNGVWVVRCECGKTDYVDADDIKEDVEYLINAMSKIRKK